MELDLAKQRQCEVITVDYKSIGKIEEYCQEGYIVVINNLKRTIFNDINKEYHSQIFSKDEMMYCPLNHIKVPLHRKATSEEILKYKYSLPKILSYDIICRWKNFKPGDVIAIERSDGTTYFRVVF
jgi:DNA-directed RNA polymerase subunit H (RpoH/RPB5)